MRMILMAALATLFMASPVAAQGIVTTDPAQVDTIRQKADAAAAAAALRPCRLRALAASYTRPMVTVSVLLTLHLPGVQSLKDKRAIVRSLVARLRSRLDLTAAEVGAQDLLQRAEVGFAVVSEDGHTARRLADEQLAVRGQSHDRRQDRIAGRFENVGLTVANDGHFAIRRAEIDADDRIVHFATLTCANRNTAPSR